MLKENLGVIQNPFQLILEELMKIEILIESQHQTINLTTSQEAQKVEILYIKEASAFLNLRVSTLYIKSSIGLIPVMKQENKLFFEKHQLIVWLKTGKKTSVEKRRSDLNEYLSRNQIVEGFSL